MNRPKGNPRKLGTRNHPDVGARVEIPAWSDLWMRGARFGTVERVVATGTERTAWDVYRIRMDHPQVRSTVRFYADDVRFLDVSHLGGCCFD